MTEGMEIYSKCRCAPGEYWDKDAGACAACDSNCLSCIDSATKCVTCHEDIEGWLLNMLENKCECKKGYAGASKSCTR